MISATSTKFIGQKVSQYEQLLKAPTDKLIPSISQNDFEQSKYSINNNHEPSKIGKKS